MILTVAQVRQHIVTGLGDDALLRLIEAAEGEITSSPIGSSGEVLRRFPGGHELLELDRPAGTVSEVIESADSAPLTLDEDDYRIEGYILRRLDTGTNPRTWWEGPVDVTHTPTSSTTSSDAAHRERTLVALVKIDLAMSGYVTEATQDEQRAPWEYQVARRRILESLTNDAVMAQ